MAHVYAVSHTDTVMYNQNITGDARALCLIKGVWTCYWLGHGRHWGRMLQS